MTERDIYNLLMNNAKYRKYLETNDYKRLFAEVCNDDRHGSAPTPKELSQFLLNANIKIVRDGIVPPQAYKDSSIKTFDFKDVKKIGVGAFMNTPLETADLRNVSDIQAYAFMNSQITELVLPKEGTIGYGAFGHCQGLTELYIPPMCKLSGRCFEACTNLEEVFIEDGRTEFTPGVFTNVNSISVVYIPKDIAVLTMFTDNAAITRQELNYAHRSVVNIEGKRSFKINNLIVLGEEDPEFVKQLSDYRIQVNNVKFTG